MSVSKEFMGARVLTCNRVLYITHRCRRCTAAQSGPQAPGATIEAAGAAEEGSAGTMSSFAGTTEHQREHKLPRVTAVKNKQAAPTQASSLGWRVA